MIGTLRYVIQQLSKDDAQFTIDMLIDEIVALEKKLDSNEKAVNELNLENRELKKKLNV
jgi:transcription initiation factor IIF auxiliary subunit